MEPTQGVISAEGKIGKNKARGSIDKEGIWDLGIDFKVGGLGITNDYGGAITISIAGQSITWGKEGGKIHYDLGGFEIIVEARDCVVTETKLIMGIEVASHTYPDPGCELPDPEEQPEPFPVPEPDPSAGIGIPATEQLFWVPAISRREDYGYTGTLEAWTETRPKISNKETGVVSAIHLPFDMSTTEWTSFSGERKESESTTSKGAHTPSHVITTGMFDTRFMSDGEPAAALFFKTWYYGSFAGFIDTGININKFLNTLNQNNSNYLDLVRGLSAVYIFKIIPIDYIAVGEQQKPRKTPLLKPGVPPHMKNDCCEEILESLDDLKEVLHVEYFQKNQFPVPSYLLAPGVDASHKKVANNYYNLFQNLFQALAHSTIVSPKIDIQDADAVKEGDQTINSQYLSATGWAEGVTKILYEIVNDGNVGTNMDIRTGVAVTQVLVAMANLSHKVDCIIDCIGITTKRTKDEVETTYNLVVEGSNPNKGFDPKKANQKLDLNSDISTEQLLSSLLKTRINPIVKEEIHPKSPTLFELLQDLKHKE